MFLSMFPVPFSQSSVDLQSHVWQILAQTNLAQVRIFITQLLFVTISAEASKVRLARPAPGCPHAAFVSQFLGRPRTIVVVKVRGHVGNSTITTSGARQGCPLSPTLFGVYIDALEGYLHDRVPLAGITLNTPDGGTRLLASLIYADDIVLMDGDPDSLQRTLDSFAAFCTAYGLEISLNKTKIMQFLPNRRRGQPPPMRHAFALGSYDLETVDVYKYLGVSFCCSGNPADYMACGAS